MSAIAAQRGIPFATYEKGFIHDGIVVTPQAAASRLTIPHSVWDSAQDHDLSDAEAQEIDAYLDARRRGAGTLDNFWRNPVEDVAQIRGALRLEPGRPLVVMFCNILWDSAVVGRDLAFASMGDWVLGGIEWAVSHPEADLVIRIHPAEVGLRNHPTRERMADHIAAHAGVLPRNVRVVQAEDPTSSYVFMDLASLGLVYTSTVGLELAARGVPVVVAADTHYRGRGFTTDPNNPGDYWAAADRLLASPPDAAERARTSELARRYASLFFFRFHNVLAAVTEDGRSSPRIRVTAAKDLDPGSDPAMDRVVAAVLDGTFPIAPPDDRTASQAASH
jgi:hypothetical protein